MYDILRILSRIQFDPYGTNNDEIACYGIKNGMTEDHSWTSAAQDYVSLYSKLIKKGK